MRWKFPERPNPGWQPWFAWRPVYGAGSGYIMWLEWVERKYECACGETFWYYRPARP